MAATHTDVIIIGAGAAGLMCAAEAGAGGARVLVLDHANKVGKKILMSGGGRCNFTHLHSGPENFIGHNPHFCKSALSRYTPYDFLDLVERHGIAYEEKTPGQLFCQNSAKDIVQMLLAECRSGGAQIRLRTEIEAIDWQKPFHLKTSLGKLSCDTLVIATGGYSVPSMGASGFGYELARRLGINVHTTRPGLVPFTLPPKLLASLATLSGISLAASVRTADAFFQENILFTHRGLSGPGVLQASSYWHEDEAVAIDLWPQADLLTQLATQREQRPRMSLKNFLATLWPRRLAEHWCTHYVHDKPLNQLTVEDLKQLQNHCQPWTIKPAGTEGYRTAEVTVGGVDTDAFSSKTLACKQLPGLYFIGEVLDVTGHLGGHNFQWAWASAVAAGQAITA
ncbi:NAD(P)/FAD-dependent oxidoreductase [Ectothiorhodosinus mongolicus]|nr:NAD(P)/FAD-dependent oxidoreductase [Ectothiorhodosinus mongolicus]ULX57921.1 NAD(P)/FAD-dependent oxidoreductase [Ectothiorhodosinus mongolicus]